MLQRFIDTQAVRLSVFCSRGLGVQGWGVGVEVGRGGWNDVVAPLRI